MEENQRKVNYFTQIYKSVSDINFYKYFESRSVGKAFMYLFIMTLILGTLSLIRPIYDYNRGVVTLINSYNSEIPEFELKDGILDVKSSGPIIIDEDSDNVLIIDTTGQTDEKVLENYNSAVFFSRDKMYQKKNGVVQPPMEFSEMGSVSLNKQTFERFIPILKLGIFFIVVFGLIWFFISKLFSIFILSCLGAVVYGIARFRINYGTIIKLSFYAITAPVMVKIILSALAINIPFFAVIYYGIGALYLGLAGKMLFTQNQGSVEEF